MVERWLPVAEAGAFRSCYPQRGEFLRSARNLAEYSTYCRMYAELYPEVTVPKSAGQWISTLQYRAAERGQNQCLSAVDLQVCATAAHHGLVVVHDDSDFVTASRLSVELQQVNVHEGPSDPEF